jgi:hypothetical protein
MLYESQANNKSLTESIMSTYTRNPIAEHGALVGLGFGRVLAHNGRAVSAAANGKATLVKRVKNVALFFAAPYIGLAYLLAFPFVGFAMLAWIAAKAAMKSDKARPIVLAIAAPFIALAFVTVGPIVGLGALAWTGVGAVLKA